MVVLNRAGSGPSREAPCDRPPDEHRVVPWPTSGGEPLCSVAVLADGSRRLPGITQRIFLHEGLRSDGSTSARPIALHNHGPFPGAACCQIEELPPYKAAPLQTLGRFCALRVCKPFRVHPSPFKRQGVSE